MTNNLTIGITGGIGSGKSVVCRIFGILGVPVYDADSRSKSLLNNDPVLKSKIVELFGPEAYTPTGLNNTWMAGHVFGNKEKLEKLNRIVHPNVGLDFEKWKNEMKNAAFVIKEAALLFESGSYKGLDKIIVVTAPEELRIERVLKRDTHRSREQVKAIIERQWSEEDKVVRADYLIVNDGVHMLVPQVLSLHEQLITLSNSVKDLAG